MTASWRHDSPYGTLFKVLINRAKFDFCMPSSFGGDKAGVSNLWASGGHIACWESCREPHEVFDLIIATSSCNDLSNVARSEVDLQKRKKGLYLSSISTLSPLLPESSFGARGENHFQMKKNLHLSSVACVKGFKSLFKDETSKCCRNPLRILESSRGP